MTSLTTKGCWATCQVLSPDADGDWRLAGAFDAAAPADAVRWVTEGLAQVYPDASELVERSRGLMWAANERFAVETLLRGCSLCLVFRSDHLEAQWRVRPGMKFLRLVGAEDHRSPGCDSRAVPVLRDGGSSGALGGVDLRAMAIDAEASRRPGSRRRDGRTQR